MMKKFNQTKHYIALVSGLLGVVFTTTAVTAADEQAEKPKPPPPPPFIKAPVVHTQYTKDCKPMGLEKAPKGEKRRTFALDPANFRRMEKAAEFMNEEQWDSALEVLTELEQRAMDSRPYDLAKAREYLGYVWLSKNDYDKAIGFFKQVIDQKILPVRNEQSLIRNVAGLYLSIDPPQPDRAMGIITKWFETAVRPKPNDYILLGQAAVLGKEYVKAICPVRMAVTLAERPKSSWFDILVAAHFELKDFEGASVIALERLLSFPEEAKYWRQLSGLYNKLDRPEEALILLELAYKQGHVKKGSEYRNLASMYAINELSYKAARVLQEGLDKGIVKPEEKTWRQTAVNWQFSRENVKAVAAYEKAGELAEHGKNELRIGGILTEMEKWSDSAKYYQKAIDKGGLKDSEVGRAYMSMGIALHNSGRSDDAITALKKAQDYRAVRRNASQWINFVRDEMKYANN